jgi:hypothetical protein
MIPKIVTKHAFSSLAILTSLMIVFELYYSVFCDSFTPNDCVFAGTVINLELEHGAEENTHAKDPFMVVGVKPDGGRLPLALINFSESGEMSLSIRSAGKSNDAAKGSEVWLLAQYDSHLGFFPQADAEAAGWRMNPDIWHVPAVVSTGGGNALDFSLQDAKGTIFFIRHPWSGFCEIGIGSIKSMFDLYDANQSSVLPVIVQSENRVSTSSKLSLSLPANTITEIALVRSLDSKWIVSKIEDGQGNRLKKSEKTANYLPLKSTQFRAYWLLLIPVLLLILLAVYSTRTEQVSRKSYYLCTVLLAATVTSFLVMVFYPGVMTPDSYDQWGQAKSGYYNDWHPIGLTLLMAACQRILYFCSENTQVAMTAWFSGVLFWISCHALVRAIIRNVKFALLVMLLVTLYFPFWPYTVTLWKDVLFTTTLLFLAAHTINVARRTPAQAVYGDLLISMFLIVLMLLNRQTAWAVMLACLPGLVLFMPRVIRLRYAVIFIVALISAVLINKAIYSIKSVSKAGNLSNMYLAFDLVGTLHFANVDLNELARLKTTRVVGLKNVQMAINRYEAGNSMNYLIFGNPAPFRTADLLKSNCILQDLPRVALRYPKALLQHKISIQKVLWDRKPDGRIWYVYQTELNKGDNFNIYPNTRIPKLNATLRHWLITVSGSPDSVFQLFLRHSLIFLGMVTMIAVVLIISKSKKSLAGCASSICFLGWTAFSCWLPNALVLPGPDWRYLLPTTSIGVIVIISTVCQFVFQKRRREAAL